MGTFIAIRKTADSVLRYGVPRPFAFEAPSSWVSRLALAQGCSLEEMMHFLQLGSIESGDLDLEILGSKLPDLLYKCSLPKSAFAYAAFAMSRFSQADLQTSALRRTWRDRARFRYCPACLAESQISHLDIRCRFSGWTHCLPHSCQLEDRCQVCGTCVSYPIDMEQSAAGKSGHASQRRCQECSADLASARPTLVNLRFSSVMSQQGLYRLLKCWPSCAMS